MEALGRVELPTFGLGNRCSIHLSYRAERKKDAMRKLISAHRRAWFTPSGTIS